MVGRIGWPASDLELVVTALTVTLAVATFLFAYLMYCRATWPGPRRSPTRVSHPEPWSTRVPWLQTLLEHKYYFDEIYNAVFVRPMDRLAELGRRDVDQPLIDGPWWSPASIEASGGQPEPGRERLLPSYVLVFLGGAFIAGLIVLWRASRLMLTDPLAAPASWAASVAFTARRSRASGSRRCHQRSDARHRRLRRLAFDPARARLPVHRAGALDTRS